MRKQVLAVLPLLLWLNSFAQTSGSDDKRMKVRLQFKAIEYCMGSVYNGGFIGLQSGIRAEAYLMRGTLIPEIQYNHGWLDMEKMSFPNEDMKPFSDLKVGIRIGRFQEGGAAFRNLHCIDRVERNGNIETTYYEDETVHGDLHLGLTAGMYMSRAFLKSAFTEESGMDASVGLNTTSIYAGFAITKMIDNKAKEYRSGNVCIWDKYSFYYANVLLAVNHQLSEFYYIGGAPGPLAANLSNSATTYQDLLRDFRPFGFMIGFEGGRWRKGFVGSYEVGMIPSLKGKGFFFMIGASFALGIG